MKYKIIVFGCGFNQIDAERAAAVLEKIGYQSTEKDFETDLFLVLACSVRQSAIDRVMGLEHRFNQIKKTRPIITLLSGCVLPTDKSKMSKFFDIVFPINDLVKLPVMLAQKSLDLPTDYLKVRPSYRSTFQASVPVINGCNNFCTYCAVPYVRGREKSRKAKDVLAECQALVAQGYKYIELLGQNVNSYQDGRINFPKLLKQVDNIPGDYWLSFASCHPKDMSDELIAVMGKAKHLIPYLNLPLQAGDNEVIQRMNRNYMVSHYKNLIRKIRKAVPGIAVSTDMIVGFPGETRTQFNNTAKLMKEVEFDMAFLARYSPRPGTAAAKLVDDVKPAEKKRREEALNKILKQTALKKNQVFVGQNIEALVTEYRHGFCFGRTKHFKNIKFKSEVDLTGQLVLVKVTSCYSWGLRGELPKVVVILGTTSAGKTSLAVKLARKFKGEIISADSRQVYTGMDIGTGKDLEEYGKIPHHLIDAELPKNQYTLAQWQQGANAAVKDVLQRQKLPIVCGGTGLYISALVDGYQLAQASEDKQLRNRLARLTLKQLLARLKKVDPKTYEVIDRQNRRRVQRALEIYYQTGITKSQQAKPQKPPYQFLKLGITFPKEVLKARIAKRLKHRLEKEGMIEEIKKLHQQGVSYQRLEEFGLEYRWVGRYLRKQLSYEEMYNNLEKAINDFAKRQMTWFKRDQEIEWVSDYQQAERKIRKFLSDKG
ncbi:MAG: tRNA (N6-isopentenyl adenosine(37)-C2)-methylthiotransferase MiaB [Patescibacteria group bacterium]|jgi:tRNA-2-methylthio-N6-dimethylallyladenosine synthase|nr:tRNA (N6-isopentenyl adenosine(37)-C2)-methylthiotransferase MiaB [Patescibacteria group bacterium]